LFWLASHVRSRGCASKPEGPRIEMSRPRLLANSSPTMVHKEPSVLRSWTPCSRTFSNNVRRFPKWSSPSEGIFCIVCEKSRKSARMKWLDMLEAGRNRPLPQTQESRFFCERMGFLSAIRARTASILSTENACLSHMIRLTDSGATRPQLRV